MRFEVLCPHKPWERPQKLKEACEEGTRDARETQRRKQEP